VKQTMEFLCWLDLVRFVKQCVLTDRWPSVVACDMATYWVWVSYI